MAILNRDSIPILHPCRLMHLKPALPAKRIHALAALERSVEIRDGLRLRGPGLSSFSLDINEADNPTDKYLL